MGLDDVKGAIDFVFACAVVHEMPGPGPFFNEAAGALKPGATLLLAEPAGHVMRRSLRQNLTRPLKRAWPLSATHRYAVVARPCCANGDDTQEAVAQLRQHPVPSPQEALNEPFAAFPSWFVRIEYERCGKTQMVKQAHMPRSELPLRTTLARMRHEHCGGRPAKAELLTGTDAASSGPVRRIVLRGGSA
jgi:hypothetical protein